MPLNAKGEFSDPVLYLEAGDFDDGGNLRGAEIGGRPIMMMIYAEWCGHCKTTRPEFQKAADNMKDVFFCVVHSDSKRPSVEALMRKMDTIYPVKGYPTILMITRGGSKMPYEGERKAEAFQRAALNLLQRG